MPHIQQHLLQHHNVLILKEIVLFTNSTHNLDVFILTYVFYFYSYNKRICRIILLIIKHN